MVGKDILNRENSPITLQELADVFQETWNSISHKTIDNHFVEMHLWVHSLLEGRGGNTDKYII